MKYTKINKIRQLNLLFYLFDKKNNNFVYKIFLKYYKKILLKRIYKKSPFLEFELNEKLKINDFKNEEIIQLYLNCVSEYKKKLYEINYKNKIIRTDINYIKIKKEFIKKEVLNKYKFNFKEEDKIYKLYLRNEEIIKGEYLLKEIALKEKIKIEYNLISNFYNENKKEILNYY